MLILLIISSPSLVEIEMERSVLIEQMERSVSAHATSAQNDTKLPLCKGLLHMNNII